VSRRDIAWSIISNDAATLTKKTCLGRFGDLQPRFFTP
jgi:hypothetical protein